MLVNDASGTNTQTVRVGQPADFRVEYSRVNSAGLVPAAVLTITRNGKPIMTVTMDRARYDNRPAFHKVIRFKSRDVASKLYAHFQLSLGPARAKRDRRFALISG